VSRAVIYVAHPLSGTYAEMSQNRLFGSHWCAWLCRHFQVATIADWIVLSSVLEETAANRTMGLDCDLSLIERCDALVLVGTRISTGMRIELEHAKKLGKPVIDLTVLGIRCPTHETRVGAIAERLGEYGIREAA
jgi:hypothetical protein